MRRALACALALLLAGAVPAGADTFSAGPAKAKLCAKKPRAKAKGALAGKRRATVRRCAKRRGAKQRPSSRTSPAKAPALGAAPAAALGTTPSASGPVGALGATPAGAAPAVAAPACDPSPWLGAIAEDVGGFRLRLTRACVPAGRVLVQFRNLDLSLHNLYVEGVSPAFPRRMVVDDTDGETTAPTAELNLSAGEVRLFCSIGGHEVMTRRLTVTG